VNRLQRYIFRLSIFDFTLEYRKGIDNGNADCLSRLPLPNTPMSSEDKKEEKRFEVNHLKDGSKMDLNMKLLAEETKSDDFLIKLLDFVENGWDISEIPAAYKAYFSKNNRLSIETGVLSYNGRAIIPESLKTQILQLLHSNHAGIVKMKQMARQYVYWEGMDNDIKNYVDSCENCQAVNTSHQGKTYGTWPIPKKPFDRVHLDFFHFMGKTFLIFIDAYSRWLEIRLMKNTNSLILTKTLKSIFRIFGACSRLVTDNGPPFNCYDFKRFCYKKDIELSHSPPYHPASNGIVERAVQTAKSVLKKNIYNISNISETNLLELIESFLENYNNSPHTLKNIVPAHAVFKYKTKNKLNFIKKQSNKVTKFKKQVKMVPMNKNIESRNKNLKSFQANEEIWYRNNFRGLVNWHKGKILKKESKHIYKIEVKKVIKLAHVNQLKKIKKGKSKDEKLVQTEKEEIESGNSPTERVLRRSERERKKPDWFRFQ